MSYSHSTVLIIPAAFRDAANRVSCALGHDTLPGSTYGVPLSADGQAPATHYGAHTWATPGFVASLYASGAFPPPSLEELGIAPADVAAAGQALAGVDWTAAGITSADVTAVSAALIASAKIGANPSAHFAEVLAANALQEIADA